MSKEMINHPSHYNKQGKKECIVEMEELFGIDACVIFAIANAYKYNYRCGEKDIVEQELGKLTWYEEYAARRVSECGSYAHEVYQAYWSEKDKNR